VDAPAAYAPWRRSHLGQVPEDGPEPNGLRDCMNGVATAFRAA
jgi:peptide methionine sulfoxide reductase MsrB